MFEYFIKHEMSRIFFDPFQPKAGESAFASGMPDWKDLYGDINQQIPQGMPEELGKIAHTMCFFNSNHAGNIVT